MAQRNPLEAERANIAALLRDWPPGEIDDVITESLKLWQAEDLATRLRWCWNPRLRTTIGRALLEEGILELNPLLLGRHPQEMRGVVIHELAHLVVTARHGLRVAPHGAQWKDLMCAAGESTRATHDLDVEGLRATPSRRRRRRRRQPVVRIVWKRRRK
ncbi:MAG: SprT family zinc-dependent metalloprotease [Planctomycetota bacterium]|jgi:predicted SprT family Zn-dependent metalloprotease